MSVDTLKVLFLGDVFASPGREAVKHFVPRLTQEHEIDLVLVNVENAAHGRGVNEKIVKELQKAGVDMMTGGNHIYGVPQSFGLLNQPDSPVLRPYNFSRSGPGRGVGVVTARNGTRVGVINIMGRTFMEPGVNLPFQSFDEAYQDVKDDCDIVILDFHAEATAEKRAMGWHVDGRVQLMVGTHTHVQTADEEVLPKGTAYITDLGMTGPYDSVIGTEKSIVLKRFRDQIHERFEPATGDVRLCGIICEIDVFGKRAKSIRRVCERM
jgi:metallophosphoesterase (TIGR00282 family)